MMTGKLSELRATCLERQTQVKPWLQMFSFLLSDHTLESYNLETETKDQASDLITMRKNYYELKQSVARFMRSFKELEAGVGWHWQDESCKQNHKILVDLEFILDVVKYAVQNSSYL